MPIATINPANNRFIRGFDPLTEQATYQKISLADEAFRANAHIPIDHRALWMRKLAAILDAEVDELAATITLEMGKPIHAARLEVQKCALACRYYADNAARILAPEHIPTGEHASYIRYEPLGVILAIMPWNFPFWQVFRFLAPALMSGNTGLLKHASNVPECALTIESLVRRAGFPRGTFQTLLLGARHIEHVLSDPRIAAVTLTGSEPAGRAVAAQAGWLIKKSVLELGGSDPFIVLPSADLDRAVETAVRARCVNTGQSCIAAKRFLIHDSIYDAFTRRFVDLMNRLRVGDPMLEETDLGPLATLQILEELEAQIEAAVQSGAQILAGGQRMAGAGNYFEPTVIANVPRTSPVYREEIFGPVAMLFRVRDLDEAIAIANDTPFGLAASAWTTDPTEQQCLIAEIQAGAVFINEMVASDPRLPFGGIKHSGYGRELSAAGMKEFLNAKTIVIAPTTSADQH